MTEEIKDEVGKRDKGHENLIIDLCKLYDEAVNFQFHDFKNKDYAAPKMALANRLEEIRSKVLRGTYDN